MHSFIRHIVGNDERLILITRLHWIYFLSGLIWMVCLIALGACLDFYLWRYFGSYIPFHGQKVLGLYISSNTPILLCLFGFCGVMIFVMHLIKYYATEIALTSQRIIYKTGLIFVEVEEIDLAEIRAEHVHHGMLGRFFKYGQIQLDSRFVGDIHLPALKKPYRLIKAMHSARSRFHDPLEGGIKMKDR